MNRGQMEIMGLVIIVVLVMFGVLFVVKFVVLSPEEDLSREYRDSRLAANTLTALLGTVTECRSATMSELLGDCAVAGALTCPAGTSCDQARAVMNVVFNATFDAWNKQYQLSIGGPGRVSKLSFNRGCTRDMNRETKSHPLPTPAGIVQLNLSICRPAS